MSRLGRSEALAIPLATLVLALGTGLLCSKYEPLLDGHQRLIGGDYSYFMPRLLAGNYWQRLNGWWTVQWFTPGFCGGMPAWANPQSIQFSIPQWLTQFFDPVVAVQITFALSALIGACGAFVLLKAGFETSTSSALLGAVLFLFNGFFSRRMLSGHLAFHTAVWTPWVAWLLLRQRRALQETMVRIALAGVLVALMIHGGIVVLLPPIMLSWLALGTLATFRGQRFFPFAMRLVAALGVGAGLSASKLAAMGALAAQFPRDDYPLPGFQSIPALLAAVFRGLFLRPQAATMDNDYAHPAEHEWDFGLSPVPVVLLLIALPFLVRALRARHKGLLLPMLGFLGLLTIPLAVNFYTPGWNAFLKHLPVISSNSMLIRWFYCYVPVVPVLTALALELVPGRRLLAAAGLSVAAVWALTANPTANEARFLRYDPATILKGWTQAHREDTITRIQFTRVHLRKDGTAPNSIFSGDDFVALGATQVFCYEPLFGYRLEKLPWKPLHDGPALDESDGQLNIKNPVCDLFPRENRCRPGGQFASGQRLDAEAFLSWSPIPFERSRVQVAADALNLVALAVVWIFLGASAVSRLRRRSVRREICASSTEPARKASDRDAVERRSRGAEW